MPKSVPIVWISFFLRQERAREIEKKMSDDDIGHRYIGKCTVSRENLVGRTMTHAVLEWPLLQNLLLLSTHTLCHRSPISFLFHVSAFCALSLRIYLSCFFFPLIFFLLLTRLMIYSTDTHTDFSPIFTDIPSALLFHIKSDVPVTASVREYVVMTTPFSSGSRPGTHDGMTTSLCNREFGEEFTRCFEANAIAAVVS